MRKTFQYNQYGDVRSYSDGKLKCDKLQQIDLTITQDQLAEIQSNEYDLRIENKKLVFKEKNPKDEKMEELINQAKKDYPKLTPLLEKMLKKINNQEISQNI